jgi:hypothetical protein
VCGEGIALGAHEQQCGTKAHAHARMGSGRVSTGRRRELGASKAAQILGGSNFLEWSTHAGAGSAGDALVMQRTPGSVRWKTKKEIRGAVAHEELRVGVAAVRGAGHGHGGSVRGVRVLGGLNGSRSVLWCNVH